MQRIINGVIDKAQEVDPFLCVLKLNWDSIFYRSQIAIEKNRQSNLRKTEKIIDNNRRLADMKKLS